jgi:hypothetical protein
LRPDAVLYVYPQIEKEAAILFSRHSPAYDESEIRFISIRREQLTCTQWCTTAAGSLWKRVNSGYTALFLVKKIGAYRFPVSRNQFYFLIGDTRVLSVRQLLLTLASKSVLYMLQWTNSR